MACRLVGAKPLSEQMQLIRPLGTNFSEISIEIHTVSIKKLHLKLSSAKRQPFCLGINVLMNEQTVFTMCFIGDSLYGEKLFGACWFVEGGLIIIACGVQEPYIVCSNDGGGDDDDGDDDNGDDDDDNSDDDGDGDDDDDDDDGDAGDDDDDDDEEEEEEEEEEEQEEVDNKMSLTQKCEEVR